MTGDKPLSALIHKRLSNKSRQLLQSEDAFATTLLIIALDTCGTDVLTWHPETIRTELEGTFNCRIPKLNIDKIMAAITIVTTDLFFKNESRFVILANILAGDDFQPDEFEIADSAECAWAITEALLLSPPDEEDPEPFSDNVRKYIKFVLREEGYITPPDILRIALDADYSDQVRYSFSDDPEMFSALYEKNTSKAEEINNIIMQLMQELLDQLASLQLKNGSTEAIVQKIRNNIQAPR